MAAVIHRRRTEVIMIPLFFQDIETAQRGLLHTGVGSGYEQDPYIRGCLLQYNREAYLFFNKCIIYVVYIHNITLNHTLLELQNAKTAQRGLLHTGVESGYEKDPFHIRVCLPPWSLSFGKCLAFCFPYIRGQVTSF